MGEVTATPSKLTEILTRTVHPLRRPAIAPDASLAEDLHFDDLDKITVAQECDEHWLIEIAEHEWRQWQTVEDIRATVERHAGIPV